MTLIKKLEPLLWMLFGAGAMVGAMVLPALFFVVAIAYPLGWFGDPVETFDRMRFLIVNPVGKVVLAAMISLLFWHSAHHLRHFAYDLGLHSMASAVSIGVYGLALLGTLLSFGVLGGL